ncbi:hypothetical protein B0H10DRAFT_2223017 [Mycena sp. CBHHK59/15]|nr:hypothetical protein B0H10DRAFT_2223017 [Mycena sp. CBHHK59/15]
MGRCDPGLPALLAHRQGPCRHPPRSSSSSPCWSPTPTSTSTGTLTRTPPTCSLLSPTPFCGRAHTGLHVLKGAIAHEGRRCFDVCGEHDLVREGEDVAPKSVLSTSTRVHGRCAVLARWGPAVHGVIMPVGGDTKRCESTHTPPDVHLVFARESELFANAPPSQLPRTHPTRVADALLAPLQIRCIPSVAAPPHRVAGLEFKVNDDAFVLIVSGVLTLVN